MKGKGKSGANGRTYPARVVKLLIFSLIWAMDQVGAETQYASPRLGKAGRSPRAAVW
jgi:hypothetical protein